MPHESAVLIGPGQKITSPDHIPTNATDTAFVILPGSYEMMPRRVNWHNVSLRGAESDHPPEIRLGGKGRRWLITQSKNAGDILISDITVICDPKGGVIEQYAGIVELVNVGQSNGNLYWGHGGDAVFIRNCWSIGVPDKYYVCNFDSPLKTLDWDNTHSPLPVRQGSNEAAIRYMEIQHARTEGLTVLGSGWKQAVQDRTDGTPDGSGEHFWLNCTIKMDPKLADGKKKAGVDIGDMKWRADHPSPLGLSHWVDCHLDALLIEPGPRHVIINGHEARQRNNPTTEETMKDE